MKTKNKYRNFSYFRFMFQRMRTVRIIFILFLSLPIIPVLAQEQQVIVPYTLADRDRAILTEAKVNSLDAKMEVEFESQQRQLGDIKNLFYGGFGILITLFLFMFGYIVWDRRTAMQPALLARSAY